MWTLVSLVVSLAPLALAAPSGEKRGLAPTVDLEFATVVGSSLGGIDSFLGIPYAQPPVGQLRLRPPQPITSNLGTVEATATPTACPQFLTTLNISSLPLSVLEELIIDPTAQTITEAGEDCLTLNVQRPSSATVNSNLPVVFWIYGGGFEFGATQAYNGSDLISTSVAQGNDIIYVAVNYRLGGFGWLAGKEILADGSSNLGLLDQRLGLEWVADNIAAFGGDPSKVTIWGESAGSISVFDQMALFNGNNIYKGNPLFRAAVMDSGSIIPADPVNCPKAQVVYDTVVENAGCSSASDTLACLRSVNFTTYLNAANSVPGIFGFDSTALSYLPRPDGVLLTASPEVLSENGLFAKVPFIIGDQEDEGTLFSLSQSNITTTSELVNYLSSVYYNDATVAQIEALVATYPNNASAGSPFNTGTLNEIYPQYKRIAAIIGDLTFTLLRRFFLSNASVVHSDVPSFSYLASYGFGTPVLGTFHSSDLLTAYGITPGFPSTSIQTYYINFFNTMNPNDGTAGEIQWPQWSQGQQLLNFLATSNQLLADNFREESFIFMADNIGSLHV